MTTITQVRTFDGNGEAREAWNGVLFDKFVRYRDALVSGFGPCSTAALERHPLRPGARVLDIGCGFGDTTQQIARLVGDTGEAVGVDLAPRFVETAQREAAAAGVRNARFAVADVQSDPVGGPYDHAFSRFGTMFFASPVVALRNLRRSLRVGSTLCMVVWRKKEENAALFDVERAVLAIVPLPATTEEPTCGPGPFSMASPDVVSEQLLAAGFARATFERFDIQMRVGADLASAVEMMMDIGPAGEVMRLAGVEARRREPEVFAAVQDVLRPHQRADGVSLPASTWIVTATAS
ncbi:MAG: class I SAM-dependent methyltransferase [Kofleriaceae bacterium]|nr:MAG: class I SAM-dependent methyltransferase [Kofleriaceae bacterium]MBZ0238298.1 class I SAM-dependent methyltransferase [Kofleriaceae bacterium]